MAAAKTKRKALATPSAAQPNTTQEEELAAATMEAEQANISQQSIIRCVRCGTGTLRPSEYFFKSQASPIYKEHNGYVPLCKGCLKELYVEMLDRYGDVGLALQICCHYLDWPYDEVLARKARDAKTSFPLSEYYKRLCSARISKKSFADTLQIRVEREVLTSTEAREAQEKLWDRESLQNMAYVKNIFGYDPFSDDSLTSSDRKYLFNTMAGYCPDNTIASDSHKLQSILNIVLLQLQAQKIGEQINQELAKHPVNSKLVDEYTTIQKNLYQSINNMAKENGVSASGHGGTKTANTLTERMKMLQEEGFEEIEVNMFNIEQSTIMQKIADISMNSIIKELRFEDNDYSEILEEQRILIANLTAERDQAVEQLRILNNEKVLQEYSEQQRIKQQEKAAKEQDGDS